MNITDTVIATAGPYEGRTGVIVDKQPDGKWVVDIKASEYAVAVKGAIYDARWLRGVK